MDNYKEVAEIIRRASLASVAKPEKHLDNVEKEKIPKDTFYLVHVLCLLTGMVNVLPLTFFVTANDYWMYKFRDTEKDIIDLNNKTTLQKYFTSGTVVVQSVPSALTMLLSAGFAHKIKLNLRMIGTLSSISIIFLIFTILVKVNTDTWQVGFFVVTLLSLAFVTGFLNLFQVSSLAWVPKLPQIYMKSFLFGQGLSSIFSGVLQIISLSLGTSKLTSALFYFVSGTSTIMITLLLYICVQEMAFYKYYVREGSEDTKKKHSKEELMAVFKEVWHAIFVVLIIMVIMYCTHPSITALVVSENYNHGNSWNDVYFAPTITFLFTETCSQFGRLVARPVITKTNGPLCVGLSVLRMLILVPLVIFCNAQPRNHLPVLLPHDWEYVLVLILYFFSNGFLLNCVMLSIPKLTQKADDGFLIMLSCIGVTSAIFSQLGLVAVRIL